MRRNKLFLSIAFFLFFLSLSCFHSVSAAPPVKTLPVVNAYITVVTPAFEFYEYNTTIRFNVHAYNSTNGMWLTNSSTSCRLHLYNLSGYHNIDKQMMYLGEHERDWTYDFNITTLPVVGRYTYVVDCNYTVAGKGQEIGGVIEGYFDVTGNGKELNTIADTQFSIAFMFLLMCVAFGIIFVSQYYSNSMGALPENEARVKRFKSFIQPLLFFGAYYLIFLSFSIGMISWYNSLNVIAMKNMLEFIVVLLADMLYVLLFLYIVYMAYIFTRYIRYTRKKPKSKMEYDESRY